MPVTRRRHNDALYRLSPIRRPRRATNLWSQSRWRSGCGRQRRPCTRAHSGSRRHRTAAGRLIAGGILPSRTACLAPLRAGAGFRPGADGRARERPDGIDIREDHSMKLLTEAQRTKLLANGTRRGPDHEPVVKLFNPCGAGTWLLSELDPEYPNECGFGLADLGFGTPELGSIGLLELTEYRGPFGLGIERDIHFTANHSLSIYAEAAPFTPKPRAPQGISSNRDPNSKPLPASSPASPRAPQLRQSRRTGLTDGNRKRQGGVPPPANPERRHRDRFPAALHEPCPDTCQATGRQEPVSKPGAGQRRGPSEGAVRAAIHPSHLPAWSMP